MGGQMVNMFHQLMIQGQTYDLMRVLFGISDDADLRHIFRIRTKFYIWINLSTKVNNFPGPIQPDVPVFPPRFMGYTEISCRYHQTFAGTIFFFV